MAFYEHTIVGKQDLSDKEVGGLIEKYSSTIKQTGKILKTEKWGILNLARRISNNKKGIFIHFKFEGENKTIEDVTKKIVMDDDIIRHLTVKYNKLDLEKEYFNQKK